MAPRTIVLRCEFVQDPLALMGATVSLMSDTVAPAIISRITFVINSLFQLDRERSINSRVHTPVEGGVSAVLHGTVGTTTREPEATRRVRRMVHWRYWEFFPVAVSLALSTLYIVRSATRINGHRAYLLFDDSTISLNYARNLANGHGLVWIAGQHPVEGYSNFLWTLWMATLELPHPSDNLVGLEVMISGAIILAANVIVLTLIARSLAKGSSLVPFLVGLATAVYYPLVSWTLSGMEVGLIGLWYALAVLVVLSACDPETTPKRRNGLFLVSGVLLALAALTRDDTLVVAFVIGVFVYLRSDRGSHLLRTWGPVVIAVVGHLIFRLLYYGEALPNTYYLKVQGTPLIVRLERGLVLVS